MVESGGIDWGWYFSGSGSGSFLFVDLFLDMLVMNNSGGRNQWKYYRSGISHEIRVANVRFQPFSKGASQDWVSTPAVQRKSSRPKNRSPHNMTHYVVSFQPKSNVVKMVIFYLASKTPLTLRTYI